MQMEKSLKCPNCLSLLVEDVDSCPHCKAELYNCSNCGSLVLETDKLCKNCNSNLDTDEVIKSTNDIIKTRPHYEYKSLGVLTNILMFLLASTILFSLINIYGVAKDISFIKENMYSGGVLFYDEASYENIVIAISQIVYFISLYTSIIVYFIWVRCAYRNLYNLQLKPTEHSSGWAIGSYFVPILNLFRPYSIMQEIWFGSQPDYNLEDENDYEFRERKTSTAFLKIWWASFLVNGVANNYSLRLSLNADTAQKLLTSYWVEIISYVTGIFVSLMILYLIWEISNWQSEKIKNKPTRYCQHCVNKVESDALLCPHCGKQLQFN